MKNALTLLLLALFSSLAVAANISADDVEVGKVILSMGNNQAQFEEGEQRQLKRMDSIYASDTLSTGSKGHLQIRFTDGSRLSLRPNSAFKVATYQFNEATPDEGKAVYQFIKGSMRTISGKIGKNNRENYRVETTVATIGIRGTDYALTLNGDNLSGRVNSGAINVNNDNADQDIAAGNSFELANNNSPIKVFKTPANINSSSEEESEDSSSSDETDETDVSSAPSTDDNNADDTASDTLDTTSSTTNNTNSTADSTLDSTTDTVSNTSDSLGSTLGDTVGGTLDTVGDALDGIGGLLGGGNDSESENDPSTDEVVGTGSVSPNTSLVAVAYHNNNGAISSGLSSDDNTTITVDNSSGRGDLLTGLTQQGNSSDLGQCNPCRFIGSSDANNAKEVGTASFGGSKVTWGRWDDDVLLLRDGNEEATQGSYHFIYTDKLTTSEQLATVAGSKSGSYIYTFGGGKGTSPQIENGNTGSLVNYTSTPAEGRTYGGTYMIVDWSSQNIQEVSLMANVNDGTGNREYRLVESQANKNLSSVLNGKGMNIEGTCTGGKCTTILGDTNVSGHMSLDLVGDSAQTAISSYSAEGSNLLKGDVSVVGTVVFEDSGVAP